MNCEKIFTRRDTVVVLDILLDNFYAFKNFHMNLTYPKKIVGSCISEEHLADRPNFRYKKVNIIMGANASGKTTFGRTVMKIFNFIDKKNYMSLVEAICDRTKPASFSLDMASSSNILYRVTCTFMPCANDGKGYRSEDVKLEIRREKIRVNDSYESCVKRIEESEYIPSDNYMEELENMEKLGWLFEYPEDTARTIRFPINDETFPVVLEKILKALDPSIQRIEKLQEVESAYVIRIHDKSVILQNGELFTTNLLSSGTKAGVEVARVVSGLMQGLYTFYYCDEKFPYIHSDIEKAILAVMIESIRPNEQLFFTTHNTDILDMDLPKHSFSFFRKSACNVEEPITCISASSLLKRSTDSLKNAVENDLFCTAPAVDAIYALSDS